MANITDAIEAAKKAAREKGSTGIWAVIITAVSGTALIIMPDVINYATTGDYVMAAAYGAGMIVTSIVAAVVIESLGDKIIE